MKNCDFWRGSGGVLGWFGGAFGVFRVVLGSSFFVAVCGMGLKSAPGGSRGDFRWIWGSIWGEF